MAHEFCWVEMTTDDTEAAKTFYGKLFGWTYNETALSQGGVYSAFQPSAGGPGGGIMAKPMAEVPNAWMPYVLTDDLDASAAQVSGLGGTVLVGPTPVPGHGRFAVIADPTGGVIGLWKCDESSS
jgi:predicted enzyme related to lactoylglutathione lyase